MNLRRNLILALLLLVIVVMAAAAGYRILAGPAVTTLDAIYMAVITIATVGYDEVVDTSARPSLRIFNMFVILFGIGIMLYVFSASTAFIVEGELKDIFRRRKMLKQIRDMKDHFIVCGAGETGQYVVQELVKTAHRLVVIDPDDGHLEKVQHLGEFPVLKGDAADEEVLETAGLARARGLVSVLPDDKDNLMLPEMCFWSWATSKKFGTPAKPPGRPLRPRRASHGWKREIDEWRHALISSGVSSGKSRRISASVMPEAR